MQIFYECAIFFHLLSIEECSNILPFGNQYRDLCIFHDYSSQCIPDCAVGWAKAGVNTSLIISSVLRISDVSAMDSGTYICMVSNGFESKNKELYLDVQCMLSIF